MRIVVTIFTCLLFISCGNQTLRLVRVRPFEKQQIVNIDQSERVTIDEATSSPSTPPDAKILTPALESSILPADQMQPVVAHLDDESPTTLEPADSLEQPEPTAEEIVAMAKESERQANIAITFVAFMPFVLLLFWGGSLIYSQIFLPIGVGVALAMIFAGFFYSYRSRSSRYTTKKADGRSGGAIFMGSIFLASILLAFALIFF